MRLVFIMLSATLLAGCSFDPAGRPGEAPDAALGADATDDLTVAVDASSSNDAGGDAAQGVDFGNVVDAGFADMPVSSDTGATDVADPPDQSVMADGVWLLSERLVLVTGLHGDVDDCAATANCDDLDGDGLVDEWEQLLLESFRPFVVFDEEEALLSDADAVVVHVGRVTPVRRRPLTVQMYLTILYDRDYGTCGSLTAHNGDSERVVVTLSETASGVRVERAYTAAHEGTVTDHSEKFEGADLARLEHDDSVPGQARWVVYSSKNKHATYATKSICESTSPLPCFSESCGPNYAPGGATVRLLDVVNAGEPDSHLLEDLGPIGFPGEDAWLEQAFCGGLDRRIGCPGAVRGKLTNDPF